ncbi:MAG: DUF6242 domain-containing protein [Tannerella sp.]|nr:DUF6242 domain-containing protein [Tannerella sp.]
MKKQNWQLWLLGCCVFLMSSCLGTDEIGDSLNDSNCLISTFQLLSDSVTGLENVKFTIDQVNGLIYNADSMPYGTELRWKVVCKVSFEGFPSAVEVFQAATGDSAGWNTTDSLDFSNFVRFDIFSLDQTNSKRYFAQVNIHQQVPDSMSWQWFSNRLLGKTVQEQQVIAYDQYYLMFARAASGYELYRTPQNDKRTWIPIRLSGLNGKSFNLNQITKFEDVYYMPSSDGGLYVSENCQDWTPIGQTPVVKSLLGVVYGNQTVKTQNVMCAVIQEGNTYYFATMDADNQWTRGSVAPATFPITGFGSSTYEAAFYWHLLVAAGKDRNSNLSNVVWETMDGLNWVKSTNESNTIIEKREGIMLTNYDDQLFMIGGINASNTASKEIYYSKDRGITWSLADSMLYLPGAYRPRGYSSVIVDKNNFLHLFGGKENNSANHLDELWSGRINRLGFKP